MYEKIIKDMQNIVNKNVKDYKEDFNIDKKNLLKKTNNLPMIWIVRELGTNLITFNDKDFTKDNIEDYCKTALIYIDYYGKEERKIKNKLYIIKDHKIQKSNIEQCIKQVKLNKEKMLNKIEKYIA